MKRILYDTQAAYNSDRRDTGLPRDQMTAKPESQEQKTSLNSVASPSLLRTMKEEVEGCRGLGKRKTGMDGRK